MSITDLSFILFLLASVIVYYLIPRTHRWIVLLLASAIFYLSSCSITAVYLVLTVVITYAFSLWLDRLASYRPDGATREERQEQKKQNIRQKRAVLGAALLLDFSSLVVLKYAGFFSSLANAVFHANLSIPSFLLPLGISFYVFQTAGYLIDIYRGKYHAQRSLARYALFVCYFPQMIQGPINRYNAMETQLYAGNDFDWRNIQSGFYRILFGVLKKALIADPLAPIVAEIYSGYGSYPGFISFFGAALYCLQLYCDFSAGVDIVCGASRLFGIRMKENFCQPYFATSLADFWRRWHISLGEWMKDYLFFPLALSKYTSKLSKLARKFLPSEIAKRVVPCFATFVVFLAVGMWQGPGMANIAYGLWNGFWMSLAILWAPLGNKLDGHFSYRKNKRLMTVTGILRTNLLVIIGRYFSNAASLRSALGMLKHTLQAPGFSQLRPALIADLGFSPMLILQLCVAVSVLFVISVAKEKEINVVQWIFKQKWYVQFLILFIGLLLVTFCVYGNSNYTPIAYVYENV